MEHQHWIQNVSGKSVCRFPVRDDGIPTTEAVHAAHIDLFGVQNDRVDLISLYTAWGIILRLYTGSEMIAFSALTGKSKEGIPSNETSITIFEVEVDGQTTIKKISDDFQRQTSQSVAAGSADDENWADVQGVEVPYNTLVVSDISLSKSILRDWHRTVRSSLPLLILLLNKREVNYSELCLKCIPVPNYRHELPRCGSLSYLLCVQPSLSWPGSKLGSVNGGCHVKSPPAA